MRLSILFSLYWIYSYNSEGSFCTINLPTMVVFSLPSLIVSLGCCLGIVINNMYCYIKNTQTDVYVHIYVGFNFLLKYHGHKVVYTMGYF